MTPDSGIPLGTTKRFAAPIGNRAVASRAETELPELLAAAQRVLPEYSDKLDRLLQSVVNIWDRREKKPNKNTWDVPTAISRDLDPLLRTALVASRSITPRSPS